MSVICSPFLSVILMIGCISLSVRIPVTSTIALTRSILSISVPGPRIVTVSGSTVISPTSNPFAGVVPDSVALMTNSLLTISSMSILIFLGEAVRFSDDILGQSTVSGTMTGSVSRLMICVRSAVTLNLDAVSDSTRDLFPLTVTAIVS